MPWFVHLTLGLAALYLTILSVAYFAQTWLLFPTQFATLGNPRLPPSAARLEVRTPDGDRLVGVRLPPALQRTDPPLLLIGFGGNAWNADNMALYMHGVLPDAEVVAFHYRGYPPSSGRPSAEALMADSVVIFDHLQQDRPAERVVAVGISIGSAAAAYLARHRPVAGMILVTPFDTLEALAREHYAWAPVRLLLRHRMPIIDLVRNVEIPIALIVAGRDIIVPARRTEPLRGAISNLVFDRTIEHAGHNDLFERPAFRDALREALVRIAQGTP